MHKPSSQPAHPASDAPACSLLAFSSQRAAALLFSCTLQLDPEFGFRVRVFESSNAVLCDILSVVIMSDVGP